MNFLKKNWAFLGIGLVSLLLGVLAVLTAVRLREEKPVAPTAPQSKPRAVEGSPVPECTISFTISLASPSPTPSPTPPAECNSTCVIDGDCPNALICSGGFCRNPSCATETNCLCPTPTPSPTPTPTPVGGLVCGDACTTTSECNSGMTCYQGVCRNPSCETDVDCICTQSSPTPTPTPSVSPTPTPTPLACGSTCGTTIGCPSGSGMICYITSGQTTGVCRNAACQTDSDCTCDVASPASPSPTPSVIPTVPKAGTMWPTLFLIMGGMALLILGFAL